MGTLRLALAADLAEMARLAEAAGGFAADSGLDPGGVARLLTVLDEVVSNIVSHGRLADGAMIEVVLSGGASGLACVVEDPGPPFDPLAAAMPSLDATLDERPIGGLGIHLVRQLTRDLAYSRTADGHNRLSFRLA